MCTAFRFSRISRIPTYRLVISVLFCSVVIVSGPAGGLSFSHAQQQSGDTSLPPVSPGQAEALAVNDWQMMPDGYILRHPRHRATFTANGVYFTDRRGGLEWHWQLTHIGTTDRSLRGIKQGSVQPIQDAQRVVSYFRGEGLSEQYHARAGSVEQRFILTKPLPLKGVDLVIRGLTSVGVQTHSPSCL